MTGSRPPVTSMVAPHATPPPPAAGSVLIPVDPHACEIKRQLLKFMNVNQFEAQGNRLGGPKAVITQ
jgi:hypothetical protein